MFRALVILTSLALAFVVLTFSIFRTSAPRYAFYQPSTSQTQATFSANINYDLPSAGLGPDSPFWVFKAARDKLWLLTSFNPTRRSELLLLFADKRLSQAKRLLEEQDIDLGVATAVKAEQYLMDAYLAENDAYAQGMDTIALAQGLARASLKHREVLEQLTSSLPNDAKPTLFQTIDVSKEVYEKSVQRLNEKGQIAPSPSPNDPQNQ